jgi:hypothetical protein
MTNPNETVDDLASTSPETETPAIAIATEATGVDDLSEPSTPDDIAEESNDLLSTKEKDVDDVDDEDEDDDILKSKDSVKEQKPVEATFTYEYQKPDYISDENFDTKGFDEFKDFAKQNNIPDHVFKQLLNTYFEKMNTLVQSQEEALKQVTLETKQRDVNQHIAWKKELRADTEIGGANFKTNMNYAVKAIDAFGGEPLANALQKAGLANHPVLVKAFMKIGRAIGEGEPVLSETALKQANLDPVKLFYSEG